MSRILAKFVTGGGGATPVQETPGGTVNGANTSFTLANTPTNAAAVVLTLNGLVQTQGVDYTISGATITMTTAPVVGQALYAYYSK